MVTTSAPPHPLRAGPVPATLWAALLLTEILMPLFLIGIGLPAYAQLHSSPARLVTAVLIAGSCLIAVAALTRWTRHSLRMRTPGAMRRYTWKDPGTGPRAVDLIATVLCGSACVSAVIMAAGSIDITDPPAAALILFGLALLGGGGLVAGIWDSAATVADRLPGWRRALLFPLARRIMPAILATLPLITTPLPDARALGWYGWIAAAVVTACILAASRLPLTMTERSVAAGVRQDAADLTGSITTMILSRTNPAPTLSDRQQMARKVRVGLWTAATIAGALFLFALFR